MHRIVLLLYLLTTIVRADNPPAVTPTVPSPQPPMTQSEKDGVIVIKDLEIGRIDNIPILVDIAEPKAKSPTPLPVIYMIHGGGWSHGAKGVNAMWALKGYFVFSVGYRLAGATKWPAQIEDCKLALRWLRANAAKYNINPNKVGVYGHSAGGHLVCCMATLTDPKYDVGAYHGVSSAVQAVVDLAGPSDLTTFCALKEKADLTQTLFGQAGVDHPELLAAASPVNFVKPGLPPFLVIHGDKDTMVPIAQAHEMVDALTKAGDSVQFVIVHNAGHSLGRAKNDPPGQPTPDQLDAMTIAFFDKHLK